MIEIDSGNLSRTEAGKRSFDEKSCPFLEDISLGLEILRPELLSEKFTKKVFSEY